MPRLDLYSSYLCLTLNNNESVFMNTIFHEMQTSAHVLSLTKQNGKNTHTHAHTRISVTTAQPGSRQTAKEVPDI